jgi:hypothetical protein
MLRFVLDHVSLIYIRAHSAHSNGGCLCQAQRYQLKPTIPGTARQAVPIYPCRTTQIVLRISCEAKSACPDLVAWKNILESCGEIKTHNSPRFLAPHQSTPASKISLRGLDPETQAFKLSFPPDRDSCVSPNIYFFLSFLVLSIAFASPSPSDFFF